TELEPTATKVRDHELEVLELLARELRQRRGEDRRIAGVAEDQVDRRRGGLLLAVRVVGEDRIDVRAGPPTPCGVGAGAKVQHVTRGFGRGSGRRRRSSRPWRSR